MAESSFSSHQCLNSRCQCLMHVDVDSQLDYVFSATCCSSSSSLLPLNVLSDTRTRTWFCLFDLLINITLWLLCFPRFYIMNSLQLPRALFIGPVELVVLEKKELQLLFIQRMNQGLLKLLSVMLDADSKRLMSIRCYLLMLFRYVSWLYPYCATN